MTLTEFEQDPNHISNAFIRYYYNLLHSNQSKMYTLYTKDAVLRHKSFLDPFSSNFSNVSGNEDIKKHWESSKLGGSKVIILTIETTKSYNDSLLIVAIGDIVLKDDFENPNDIKPCRKFVQTFVLVPQLNKDGYDLRNDVLTFIPDIDDFDDECDDDDDENIENDNNDDINDNTINNNTDTNTNANNNNIKTNTNKTEPQTIQQVVAEKVQDSNNSNSNSVSSLEITKKSKTSDAIIVSNSNSVEIVSDSTANLSQSEQEVDSPIFSSNLKDSTPETVIDSTSLVEKQLENSDANTKPSPKTLDNHQANKKPQQKKQEIINEIENKENIKVLEGKIIETVDSNGIKGIIVEQIESNNPNNKVKNEKESSSTTNSKESEGATNSNNRTTAVNTATITNIIAPGKITNWASAIKKVNPISANNNGVLGLSNKSDSTKKSVSTEKKKDNTKSDEEEFQSARKQNNSSNNSGNNNKNKKFEVYVKCDSQFEINTLKRLIEDKFGRISNHKMSKPTAAQIEFENERDQQNALNVGIVEGQGLRFKIEPRTPQRTKSNNNRNKVKNQNNHSNNNNKDEFKKVQSKH